MTEHQASRTLVKSPPELWTECSDASSLARHLKGSVGEIRITRLEPETTVAWEGDRMSGTVRLEPSGWGTRVVMTVRAAGAADDESPISIPPDPAPPLPDPEPQVPPVPEPLPPASARQGLMARMRAWLSGERPDAATAVRFAPRAAPKPQVGPEAEAEALAAPAEAASAARPGSAPSALPASRPAWEPGPDAILAAALDSLGRAHHRPYSRA